MMGDEIPGTDSKHASDEKAYKILVAVCEGKRTPETRRIKTYLV